ncbi:MAG: hypothetical protein WDM88_07350 [Galbitalea sp.]
MAAAIYLVYRLIRYHEWRAGLILAGLGAGYRRGCYMRPHGLPVLHDRVRALPDPGDRFVIFRLVGSRAAPRGGRDGGMRWIAVFLVAAVAISVFFWPLWTGIQIDFRYMQLHYCCRPGSRAAGVTHCYTAARTPRHARVAYLHGRS